MTDLLSRQSAGQAEPSVQITAIGGTGAFGMNCLLIQSPKTRLVIDCGIMFPAEDDLGVDLITPDFSILENNPPDLLLITHAHEDHIGAIAYLLKGLIKHGFKKKLPIYATDITLAFIRRRLEEHELLGHVYLNVVKPKTKETFGDIDAEFIDVCHSIPGSLAISLSTPVGKIVHSGDWRIDNTPMAGAKTNLGRFEALGDAGVRVFLSDSTNVEHDNEDITSELDVYNDMQSYIKQFEGRVFITLFASNIGRLQSIIYAADNTDRKLAVVGRSMVNNLELARDLGYLHVPPSLDIIREEDIESVGDKVIVIVAGSQGEKTAALYKLSHGTHPRMVLREGDTLIYSARQIPGNERRVDALINGIYRQGASIVDAPELRFHSSGHGSQRELELLIDLIMPEIFIPIHGDSRRLRLHEKLAQSSGATVTQSIDEGHSIILYPDRYEMKKIFEPSRRYVVGKCIDGITDDIAREKKNLAHQGILIISGLLGHRDELIGDLSIRALGICTNDGWLDELGPELMRTISSSARQEDMQEIVRHKAAKYVKQKILRFPTIVVTIHRLPA